MKKIIILPILMLSFTAFAQRPDGIYCDPIKKSLTSVNNGYELHVDMESVAAEENVLIITSNKAFLFDKYENLLGEIECIPSNFTGNLRSDLQVPESVVTPSINLEGYDFKDYTKQKIMSLGGINFVMKGYIAPVE